MAVGKCKGAGWPSATTITKAATLKWGLAMSQADASKPSAKGAAKLDMGTACHAKPMTHKGNTTSPPSAPAPFAGAGAHCTWERAAEAHSEADSSVDLGLSGRPMPGGVQERAAGELCNPLGDGWVRPQPHSTIATRPRIARAPGRPECNEQARNDGENTN